MPRKRKNKIIQVPMPEDLVEKLDELSEQMGESRSFLIREASANYIASVDEEQADRQLQEAYRRIPESTEDAEARLRRVAEVWGDEDFSDWE